MKQFFLKRLMVLAGTIMLSLTSHAVQYSTLLFSPERLTVVVTGRVTSDSTGEPIVNHPLEIEIDGMGYSSTRFTNHEGFYSDTIPDVGSGNTVVVSTLDCHQVVHSQSLLIISTLVVVNFEICAPSTPVECHALFSYQLDSLNEVPNTYLFLDESTGEPTRYSWDFGDGHTSTDVSTSHTFESKGQFEVCLKIAKEVSGTVICTDSLCRTVTTPNYLELGGHLFAGEFPINNPITTGDTGIAYLYRVDGTRVTPYDTCSFTTLGYFTFPQVLPGSYLVKAEISTQSTHGHQFFPGYPGQQLTWTEAQLIDVLESSLFTSDIHLSSCITPDIGPGSIQGDVTFGETGKTAPIPNAEVILFDSQMQPLCYTISDEYGRFAFLNLSYGNYALLTDYPGKYSRVTGVLLNDATISDSVHLALYAHNVTAIGQPLGGAWEEALIYPNPAADLLRISTPVNALVPCTISIYNVTGEQMVTHRFDPRLGESEMVLYLHDLAQGIYFIRGVGDDRVLLFSRKFLKK